MLQVHSKRLQVPPSSLPRELLNELRTTSFLRPESLSATAFQELIDLALRMKSGQHQNASPLRGKTVALVFFNPSLRTRASMATAIQQLGGYPLVLDVGNGVWQVECQDGAVMSGSKAEHIREMAPVIASYADIIAVRCFPELQSYAVDCEERVLTAFSRLSSRPLINLESGLHHPCQGLADMLTIREQFGSIKGRRIALTWAYHPKALPLAVPNSFLSAAALCGAEVTIAAPEGFGLDPQFVARARAQARAQGGDVHTTTNRAEALAGAEVVYAKSWTSVPLYGQLEAELAQRATLQHWQFDEAALSQSPKARFMHCLPVRRNVEVSDGVLDGPQSVVLAEAANRLHGQKALLYALATARWGGDLK